MRRVEYRDCVRCHGTGWLLDHSRGAADLCPRCHGWGSVPEPQSAECPLCRGAGYSGSGRRDYCPLCHGDGRVHPSVARHYLKRRIPDGTYAR